MRLVTLPALVLFLATGLAQAQNPQPGRPTIPFQLLTKALELTTDQLSSLVRVNTEFEAFLIEKARRATQVHAEIRVETARQTVDPMALGLRYRELELICRESRDRDRQTMTRARALMNAAQLAKLQSLEAAYALLPIIDEADRARLIQAGLARVVRSGANPDQQFPGCTVPQQQGTPAMMAEPGQ